MTRLGAAEIAERMAGVPDWRRDGDEIVRDCKLDDFKAAIALVNRVADAAEARNHHPDILVHGFNEVRLTLTNHAEGGLTAADFDAAAEIDRLLDG